MSKTTKPAKITPAQVAELRNRVADLEASQTNTMHDHVKAMFKQHLQELRDGGIKISPKTEQYYSVMFLLGATAALDASHTAKIRNPKAPAIWRICLDSGRPFHSV